jgi:hypothetical protein
MSLDLNNHISLICVWIKKTLKRLFLCTLSQFWKESVSQECLTVLNNLKMISLGVLGLGEDEGECPGGLVRGALGRKPEDAKKAGNLQNLAREFHKLDPDDYLARVTSVLRDEF